MAQMATIPSIADDRAHRKREAFKKLAEKRTNAVLDKIRILGNLANRRAYEYSDGDIRKIFAALEEELRKVKASFRATERRRFRLE